MPQIGNNLDINPKKEIEKIDPETALNPELSNQFVMLQDQEENDKLEQNQTDDEFEEIIEVKPKSSFMGKVSTKSKQAQADTSNISFKSKVGQKNYNQGKLNFNLLKKNFFSGGFKGLSNLFLKGFGLLMIFIVIIGACGTGYILYLYNNIVFDYNQEQSKTSIILASDGKTELFKIYGDDGKRQEATWDEIPEHVKLAFLSIEDENYYYNDTGISWYNLGGAVLNCGTSLGKNCRGGSSISQQVVRKLTNDDSRVSGEVVQRKLREIVRAYKLNQNLTKEDILLTYLNIVPLGRNNRGVKEAAKSYFGKDIKDLDVLEACYLATFPQNPSNYAKSIYQTEKDEKGIYKDLWRARMEGRKNSCLDKLSEKSIKGPGTEPFLKIEESKEFAKKEVKFQDDKNIYKYPHFVEYVRKQLIDIFTDDFKNEGLSDSDAAIKAENQLTNGGYKIVTTINPEIQDKVQKVIRDQAKKNILDKGADNAASVVIDNPTGEILSMVGSLAYDKADLEGIEGIKDVDKFYNEELKGKNNIAISDQQPGSSFKPYTYATAFDKGLFNPSTVMMDVFTNFDNDGSIYPPQNFTKKYSGPISIRNSLANSLNIPAVKAVYLSAGDNQNQQINKIKNNGIVNVVSTAKKMGVVFSEKIKDPEKNCGPQVALGGCEITMISHAEGMSTFARLGDRIPATPFKQICNAQGEDIYNGKMCDGTDKPGIRKIKEERYKKEEKVIDPKIAYQIIDIMTDVDARTAVFGSARCILTLNNCNKDVSFRDWQVAAKTGTSNEQRDLWTVGFTPQRTAVVWVGRTDNDPTNDSSIGTAMPIWQNVMRAAVTGTERQDFKRPDDMVSVKVNPETGLPLAEGDQGGREQWMSPDQKKKLEDSYNTIKDKAINGQLDLSKEDIFSLRSTVFGRTVQINKLDQKLVNDTNRNNIAPENLENKTFICPSSEFPWAKFKDVNNWQEPVLGFLSSLDSSKSSYGCGPTDLSTTFRTDTTPEDKRPILNISGINNGWFYNTYPLKIEVNSSTNVPGNTITDTQIFVNGEEKSSGKSNTATYTLGGGPLEPQVLNVFFKANDNQGNSVTSPIYTITILPNDIALPADANKNPAQPNTTTVTTVQPTPQPQPVVVIENPIKFDGISNGDTLSGNKDLLISTPTQTLDPIIIITKVSNKSSSQFTPKELAINGFRYRASFDFSSFEPGEYIIKFTGKKPDGNTSNSDEIKIKVVK